MKTLSVTYGMNHDLNIITAEKSIKNDAGKEITIRANLSELQIDIKLNETS